MIDLFVPGRVCLLGEHSDWAGGHRRTNSDLAPGHAIIYPTNQGIYSRAKKSDKLIFHSDAGSIELPMNPPILLAAAKEGNYVAGTAYQIVTHHSVEGIEIENYKTDLPMKKGLSSSAALCVTVARAFNRVYNLKLTTRGEMDLAYRGEITTPSRCGRMDQGCAFNKPVSMIFDGEELDVQELEVGGSFYFILVDLMAHKNTIKILAELNDAYPFAETKIEKDLQIFLGKESEIWVDLAKKNLLEGDAKGLGMAISQVQDLFDLYAKPLCPDELTAPKLHEVLNYKPIQSLIWGGKGVGSQGDGSAQLLARDEGSRNKVIEILERDLEVSCLPLSLIACF